MLVYIGNNGNPKKLKVVKEHPTELGLTFTPTDSKQGWEGAYFQDNGAYSAWNNKTSFDHTAFLRSLDKFPNPDFVVLPDIVEGGLESLKFSIKWLDIIDFLGYKRNFYLAVQDGVEEEDIPKWLLERIKGIFVGGSMDWKHDTGEAWVRFAHRHGLKCHIGRVGVLKYVMWAFRIGADSIDSANFARHHYIFDALVQWLKGEHKPLEQFVLVEQ